MDFEKASQTSLKKYFDNIVIKGCNFHLGQIIYRQIQKRVVTLAVILYYLLYYWEYTRFHGQYRIEVWREIPDSLDLLELDLNINKVLIIRGRIKSRHWEETILCVHFKK
ncbi:unnamed protein product [Diatraea saccharalis]|uniref:Uncharacterized protein n=1 Tax=Diatraea saccharalis TaxID=40085 RepID=A0A9N9RA28_9NEOP|nr:unnamed protein product [Diatraea saccharalis]